MRKTKHWFFDLRPFSESIKQWITASPEMPENVKGTALSWINEGLKPRSLTRDNAWGIPAPFSGAQGKTIYVWFEALLGYLSATLEYFTAKGEPDKWMEFWENGKVRSYYFIGKDNIPFHAVILPAMLMASERNYALPTIIGATEYLLYEGQKFSKSRKIGIWIDEAPHIMETDYWRFLLIRMRPEEKDMNFTWTEAIRIVNTELNDDIGNLVNRVVTMINRYFQGEIPEPRNLKDTDNKLLFQVRETVDSVGRMFDRTKLKGGTELILSLARDTNAYLNSKAPWDKIKSEPEDASNTLYVAGSAVKAIGLMLYPVIPTKAEVIYRQLGLDIANASWDDAKEPLKPGHRVGKPEPVFKKLPTDFEKKLGELLEKIRGEVEKERPTLLK